MIDDDAIARCQDGDRDAFRHLVDRYKDVMYGTAVLMTGNRAVAEETVQEAFLSAWRGIGGFKRGRPPKPWLIRILVNRVMDERRRQTIPTVPQGSRWRSIRAGRGGRLREPHGRPAGAGPSRPGAATGGGAQVLR